ncbi:MAG: hypothetical protein M5R40_20895 [Anaerolineae bacterium]|nr:hypothetical protein [Anaerolineae bacterium]
MWRDLADGALIVDFGGARYRRLNDVPDPDLRRRFVGLVRNLNEMADLEPEAAAHTAPSAGREDPTDATLALPGLEEEAPPHMLRQLGRVFAGQTPLSATRAQAPGIVDEIEDFLQYKLQHTPALSDRSIHIRQSVTGVGVSIEVDGHFYEGVGDVVDPDVREFLQTTVQEWQNRQ